MILLVPAGHLHLCRPAEHLLTLTLNADYGYNDKHPRNEGKAFGAFP